MSGHVIRKDVRYTDNVLTRACDWVAAWRPSLIASEARTPSLMLAPTLARDGPMQLYAVVNASCMLYNNFQPLCHSHSGVPSPAAAWLTANCPAKIGDPNAGKLGGAPSAKNTSWWWKGTAGWRACSTRMTAAM